MNNELERMWKSAAVAQVEVLFWYLNAKTLENTTTRQMASVPVKIRTGHLLNISLNGYHLS
jgi:hypothetical protein